ncbi:MAG: cobalamin B12-binding domain-containing protein [Deinococcaceae bacterium]
MEQKIRVIIAKPGMDGHDRGAKIIARALRDAGMEVIYLGLRQTPDSIVTAALQEDVDAIGLSVLSGAHMHHFREVRSLLEHNGATDIVLFGGGIIPDDDMEALAALGVPKVFTPGAHTDEVVEFLKQVVGERRISLET